jgi:hypothetical protein
MASRGSACKGSVMPVYKIDTLEKDYMTPKHSRAFGGEVHELGPRDVAHLPPNVPHSLAALEDTELVSAKGIVGGVGHRT